MSIPLFCTCMYVGGVVEKNAVEIIRNGYKIAKLFNANSTIVQ